MGQGCGQKNCEAGQSRCGTAATYVTSIQFQHLAQFLVPCVMLGELENLSEPSTFSPDGSLSEVFMGDCRSHSYCLLSGSVEKENKEREEKRGGRGGRQQQCYPS